MKKEAGKCIFCGGGNLSKEHIVPKWINQVLPDQAPFNSHILIRSGAYSQNLAKPHKSYRPRRQGDTFARTLRIVCGTCNNGWTSQLQERAKPYVTPLVKGEWSSLTPDALYVAASWFCMTAMVAEYIDPRLVAVPAEERREFMQTLEPPSSWKVFIAKFCGVRNKRVWHTGLNIGQRSIMPDQSSSCNAQVSTVTIGRVLFQAVSFHVPFAVELPQTFFFNLGLSPIFPVIGRAMSIRVLNDSDGDTAGFALRNYFARP